VPAPTPSAAMGSVGVQRAVPPAPTPGAFPFSQQRLVQHPPPAVLAASILSGASAPPSVPPPTPTPPAAASPVVAENLNKRMSMVAPTSGAAPPTPKPTPNAWSKPPAATPSSRPPPPAAVDMTPLPSGGQAFTARHRLARTPAHPAAAASTAKASASRSTLADTHPRSEYAPSSAAPLSVPSAMRVTDVDAKSMSEVGSARHSEGRKERRKSRKSFSRAVAHPSSPCSRAARAGFAMDAKSIISEVATDVSAQRLFTAVDPLGLLRSTLLHDGSVVDARGELIAYIEADGTVGDPNLQYMGEVTAANANSVGFVTDRFDELVAEVDYGRATIRDTKGSTIATISRVGEVLSHSGSRCGELDGFSFQALRQAAAFLTLVDPAFLADNKVLS
jgi:hypothetical protein